MIKWRIGVILLLVIHSICVSAQTPFRIVFYNVENLFDTKDNLETDDDDWLPDGNQYWSNYRYWQKLKAVSEVVDSVGKGYPPALIGLCEVENDSVLFDLCKRSALKKHKYRYIVTNSKDDRGMNVALLYQRDEMKLLKENEYTPTFKEDRDKHTRNILHVSGQIISGDTLDIFVCHFPSRVEGIKRTRPLRQQVAELLRNKIEKVSAIRRKANIIVMGDFNDYPDDDSMAKILQGRSLDEPVKSEYLYNMFLHQVKEKDMGTYKYQGKWQFIDQFIVNGNLLNSQNSVFIKDKAANVFNADFLLEKDEKYGDKKPFRMYLWRKYLGGFSDHLPIYLDLIVTE